jgi:hypothetical protein
MNNYSDTQLNIIDFTNINKIIGIPITIYFMMKIVSYTLQMKIQFSMQVFFIYKRLIIQNSIV